MEQRLNIRPWRLHAVMLVLASVVLTLATRVTYVTTAEHDYFVQQAKDEHWAKETVIAQRGAIRDRNGRPLAVTIQTYDISARPDAIRNLGETANKLAPLLQMKPQEIVSKLEGGRGKTVFLKNVPYEVGDQLADLGLSGILRTKRLARAYPEGNVAAVLLGFVGRDQVGLTGIERDFNPELQGKHGTLIYERDSTGEGIPLGYREFTPPIAGADLILTIDRYIQRVAETEIDKAIEKYKASGGTIIVMDPQTGEVLAMASRPSFDITRLDLPDESKMSLYRNRAITDLYEPGSTFKVITMSAAINEKRVTPNTTFYDGGVVVKYGWPIYNWDGRANGTLSMTGILQRSANVGAVWVSDVLGPDLFYKYVTRFGFGQRTDIDLAGEAVGTVRLNTQKGWSPIDLSTNSFGQGLSVTPLQMITAHVAVVNGGQLMRPYIVKEVRAPQGSRTFQPVVVRRVISEEASATMREMLNAAAEKNESKLALVPGYHIGGKTGTSSIPIAGGYRDDRTIASFIGFAPYKAPEVMVLVKIDEPKESPWGSLVASPVFSSVMRQVLTYLRVPPDDAVLVKRGT